MATKTGDKEMVAAIDFGTTYSAFAFASKNDFLQKPTKIVANRPWKTGGGADMQYTKTPTAILFDKDKKFHSFGYEAEQKFMSLALRQQHGSWYYFRRFKMLLHKAAEKEKLTLGTKLKTGDISIENEGTKEMPAIDIFSASIRHLRDCALKQMNDQGGNYKTNDVNWVLTVPAIWSEEAKQFMRKAAEKADILHSNLVLALEPEAASFCCRYLETESQIERKDVFAVNSKYVVLDVGGGTADIVSHEVQKNGSLRELLDPLGGDWGGVQVDWAFHRLLISLFGAPLIRKFKEKYYCDFLDLMKDFEAVKLTFSGENNDEVVMKIPSHLETIFQEENETTLDNSISQTRYNGQIECVPGRLIFQAKSFRALFSESVDNIKEAMNKLLTHNNVKDAKTILLVGGFAESGLLTNAIKSEFRDKKIIIPEYPSLAIVKGAVLFGHMPIVIKTRICKLTYGVSTVGKYTEGDPQHLRMTDKSMVSSVFDKFATIGEPMPVGTRRKRIYSKVRGSQSAVVLMFYTSANKEPKFVTEPDSACVFLGDLVLDKLSPDSKNIIVEIIFGDTEITVQAEEETENRRKAVQATFNFLSFKE